MTYTKKLIQKGIEGGWIYKGLKGQMNWNMKFEKPPFGGEWLKCYDDISEGFWAVEEVIFMDITFWQAVGKSLGWGILKRGEPVMGGYTVNDYWAGTQKWEYLQHRLLSHIQEKGIIEQFAKQLLNE